MCGRVFVSETKLTLIHNRKLIWIISQSFMHQLQLFNASQRMEGKETKTTVRDNTLGMALESAFALDR